MTSYSWRYSLLLCNLHNRKLFFHLNATLHFVSRQVLVYIYTHYFFAADHDHFGGAYLAVEQSTVVKS